jgi:hypothetical protein
MIAAPARSGAMGIDLDTALFAADVARLVALEAPAPRISFVVRYLGDLSSDEAATITGGGLALMAVTHPRTGALSQALGQQDGMDAVAHARAASIPNGTTVWLDLESWTGTDDDAIGYVNSWAALVQAAGFIPGLYVGWASSPLASAQLYALGAHAYWRSCSEVPDVAECGYQMLQLVPGDQQLAGLEVDLDVIQKDFRGRVPTWAIASSREAPTSPGRKSSSSMQAVRP